MDREPQPKQPERKRPSRMWYLLSAVVLAGSAGLFAVVLINKARALQQQIESMPRFVGPTDEAGVVITIEKPGTQHIFYENLGELDGKTFNTRRRQVWTTYEAPSMACTVTDAETGEPVAVRLPGQSESEKKSKTSQDQVVPYNRAGKQGHSVWVFDAKSPGEYRIAIAYDQAVYLEPGDVEVPPELSKAEKKEILEADGTIYEADRREAVERAALAELEPIDVLFAVGPDPTVGSFFKVIGLKGAATVLAFGFTFAVLTSLVTLMLRSGHVTPRGEMQRVRRFGSSTE